jgi:ATP-dependent Clp protease adaptor protein ClpS
MLVNPATFHIRCPAQLSGEPLWEEDADVAVLDDVDSGLPAHIVVYNDDHNTFEWVIQCFVEVLRHTSEQAEQLSLIIHFKGKATVKTGSKKELMPLREQLADRGLAAVIEEGS